MGVCFDVYFFYISHHLGLLSGKTVSHSLRSK